MTKANGLIQWELAVSSKDVLPVVDRLLLKHEEKIAARNLVRRLTGTPWDKAGQTYKDFRRAIKLGRTLASWPQSASMRTATE
jgi:hypothetical protein